MYSGEHQEVITIHKLLSELPLVQSNKRINDHDTECILLADRVKWHHYPPKSSTSSLPTIHRGRRESIRSLRGRRFLFFYQIHQRDRARLITKLCYQMKLFRPSRNLMLHRRISLNLPSYILHLWWEIDWAGGIGDHPRCREKSM